MIGSDKLNIVIDLQKISLISVDILNLIVDYCLVLTCLMLTGFVHILLWKTSPWKSCYM